MKKLSLSLVAGSLFAAMGINCGAAHAEGFYAGANLGAPHYADPINGIEGDGSGVSGKLYGGYQATPNFAVEAGVADLGHIEHPADHVDGRAAFLDGVGLLPLNNQWSLLGRVGVAHVNLDTSRGDDSGTALKVGLGTQYTLTSNVALRGEWERYHAHIFDGRPDIDQYTVGVRVGF